MNHEVGKCSLIDRVARDKLTCVLCKKSGHPANYRGCEVIKKVIQNKIKNKNPRHVNGAAQRQFVTKSVNQMVSPNLSFATVAAKNSNKQNSPSTNKIKDMLDEMTYETFGCSYDILNAKFLLFMGEYNKSNNVQNKQLALLNFMYETQFNG